MMSIIRPKIRSPIEAGVCSMQTKLPVVMSDIQKSE